MLPRAISSRQPSARLAQALAPDLAARKRLNLYRQAVVLDSPQGVEPLIDGCRYLSFCSNDYLGLANDPRVVEALQRAAADYGVGSGASHLVTGHARPHYALEEELADFTGRERTLLFSTGYMANLAIATTLAGRSDTVYQDRQNHASLLDAAVLSRSRLRRYAHADSQALSDLLSSQRSGRKLVLTDGVFSMDGDIAPLARLADVAATHAAWLMVDDAHGIGVLGATGRGTLEHCGLTPGQVPILMGTLGKAFGTAGAFVAGSAVLIETLIQRARSYTYTTAMPPALAAATSASLRIARDEPWRRHHLSALVARFRQGAATLGIALAPSNTPIQPLILGAADAAVAAADALRGRGIFVTPIRPPTVPTGSARLRITFSSAHEERHVDRLLDALSEVLACR